MEARISNDMNGFYTNEKKTKQNITRIFLFFK